MFKSPREDAMKKLKAASDSAVVAEAFSEMEASLRNGLPSETRDALATKLPAERKSVRNLIWSLRSTRTLEFRQEPNPKNTKRGEVRFERDLIQEAGKGSSWANQIVLWRGLCDARRADIDLGFREPDRRSFELYELKLNNSAGKEHEAIVELASYTVGYLFARILFSKWMSLLVQKELRRLRETNALLPDEKRWLSRGRLLQNAECELVNAGNVKWTLVAPQGYFGASPEQRRIWQEGLDRYLADAPRRFDLDQLTMVSSFKEMAFRNLDELGSKSLVGLVRDAKLLNHSP